MRQYGDDVQLSAGAIYQAGVSELNQKYAAAVERGQKTAQDAGKLDEALAFKNESKLLAEGGGIDAETAAAPAELKKLRGIYHQSLARLEQDKNRATIPIYNTLITGIDQLVISLTKAGRLDEAVFVKNKKDNLAEETAKAAAKAAKLTPSVAVKAAFTNSLGMKFVPLPGTNVLMCIHQTRNADYALYAAAVPGVKASPVYAPPVPAERPDEQPVRNLRYIDAVGFCEWLSKKEGRTYRLRVELRRRHWRQGAARSQRHAAVAHRKEYDGLPMGYGMAATRRSRQLCRHRLEAGVSQGNLHRGLLRRLSRHFPGNDFQTQQTGAL